MSKNRKITSEHAESLIKNSLGLFFTVDFVKANGTLRRLNGRLHVTKGVKGTGAAYSASDYGYLTVYDVQAKAYRTVNLATLRRVSLDGASYTVV